MRACEQTVLYVMHAVGVYSVHRTAVQFHCFPFFCGLPSGNCEDEICVVIPFAPTRRELWQIGQHT